MRFAALLVATLVSTAASAQITHIDRPDTATPVLGSAATNHWSIYSGETVSPGRDAIAFDLGWPGITFGYLHGLSDRSDVRLNIELLYGYENTNSSVFGFGLGAPLRLVLNRTDKVTLGVHIDPGFRVYTQGGSSAFLMRFPVGGTLAIHVVPQLDLTVGADIPFAVQLTSPAFLIVGPLFGFAVEYKVDRNLNVGLHTRFGPLFSSQGNGAVFGFQTLIGVGYRL